MQYKLPIKDANTYQLLLPVAIVEELRLICVCCVWCIDWLFVYTACVVLVGLGKVVDVRPVSMAN